ncbi:efflux transporter outer membrane subunit [Fretibacter rubidus]|uniref:efflux transporter outer membrane subunit n=1 Tax=Fretibacter rubidus TaxID=570162 RepID=UPI00352AD263
MKHLLGSVLLSAFLLSGCETLSSLKPVGSSQTDISSGLQSKISEVPQTWQASQARLGDVQIGWIDRLNDPILSGLVREAILNNRDLQAAAANVERAYALARQAGVPLKPTIGASGGGDRTLFLTGPIPDTSAMNWGVSASWEPDIWGRLKATQKSAYASAESADADYIYAQHSIAAAVAQTYLAAIEALLQIDVSKKSLATLSETDRIVDVQYAEGLAMAQDVALSESDLAGRRADVAVAEGRYRASLRALELLVGRYPAADIETSKALPTVPALPNADTPLSLIERRPDIVSDGLAVAASFYNLDQTKANRLPTLSLSASTGSTSDQLKDLLNPDQIFINLASSLTYLIFDNGFNKALVEEATAQQRAALSAYAGTILKSLEEVETSLDQLTVLELQVNALRLSASEANRALRIANIRYNEGEADLLDTLNIEARVVSAESALVSAERAVLNEWITLNLALGGSWE